MGSDISHHHIDTLSLYAAGGMEHCLGFSYAFCVAEKNLELSILFRFHDTLPP